MDGSSTQLGHSDINSSARFPQWIKPSHRVGYALFRQRWTPLFRHLNRWSAAQSSHCTGMEWERSLQPAYPVHSHDLGIQLVPSAQANCSDVQGGRDRKERMDEKTTLHISLLHQALTEQARMEEEIGQSQFKMKNKLISKTGLDKPPKLSTIH